MELQIISRCRCLKSNHHDHGVSVGFPEPGVILPDYQFIAREKNLTNNKRSGSQIAIYTVDQKTVTLKSLLNGETSTYQLPNKITNSSLLENFKEGDQVEILCNYIEDKIYFENLENEEESRYYPSDFPNFMQQI